MLPQYPICFAPILGAAQLDVYNKVVFIDNKFEDYPESVIEWLYQHELAHILYNTPDSGRNFDTESACDDIAFQTMRSMGYKKPIILGAMDMALQNSNEKTARINYLDSKY